MRNNTRISIKKYIVPSIPIGVLLIGTCLLLWVSAFVGERFATVPLQKNFILVFLQLLIKPNTLISNLVAIVFCSINAFLLSQINNRYTIIRSRTFLPALIFMLLMSSWNETHSANGSHAALMLFIISLFIIFSMFHDRKTSEQAFLGSFLISLCSIFINPLIFIIPIFWIGFMMLKSFSLRSFLGSIIGTLTPWIIYLACYYFFNSNINLQQIINLNTTIGIRPLSFPIFDLIYIAALTIIMIISLAGMFSIYSRDAIHTRKKLNFLLLLLISIAVLSILYKDQSTLFLPIIAFLYSILVSHPFTLKQNTFYNIVFIVFFAINIIYVISKYIIL